jgi:hypothetical protein
VNPKSEGLAVTGNLRNLAQGKAGDPWEKPQRVEIHLLPSGSLRAGLVFSIGSLKTQISLLLVTQHAQAAAFNTFIICLFSVLGFELRAT